MRVFDLDPTTDTDRVRARVGYMPEHDCLPPDLSAAEFVTHLGRISGLPRTAARERASEALRHVGLYEERYRQIGGYSTGMKQRVKLAQALVHDPDLLLLDEPTNGLDPAGRDAMLALVHRIGTEFGISVLVCSHLLGEVERICDSLVAIDGGRLLRADRISAMTTASDVLAVEVSEGTEELAAALGRAGPAGTPGRPAAARTAGRRRGVRPDPAARWPSWTCRCTAWTSGGTASPSSSRRRRPPMSEASVIHDIGYQRYDGPRLGRGAVLSARSTCTGCARRSGWAGQRQGEDLPLAGRRHRRCWSRSIVAAVRSQTGVVVLNYIQFDDAMSWLVIFFVAIVAPELVSRDLRSGVLPLYFSRPLRAADYVAAKVPRWSRRCGCCSAFRSW